MSKRPSDRRPGARRRSCLRPLAEPMERRDLLATFTVTSANDTGTGTLRDAIEKANANIGGDAIRFTLPDFTTINVRSGLPTITGQVDIDGRKNAGQATPLIAVDGNGSGGDGFVFGIGSGGSTIRGLAINDFSGSGVVFNSGNNLVEACYIGVDPIDGQTARGNGRHGILINSSNNRIGGAAAGNVVRNNGGPAGGNYSGITVGTSADPATPFVGNFIQRTSLAGNARIGIDLGDDGVTPNDPIPDNDNGPNRLQNFPVVETAVTTEQNGQDTIRITSRLQSRPNTAYTVEFFHSGDPGVFTVQGETSIAQGKFTTDANGVAIINFTSTDPSQVRRTGFITMTATDPLGNTSEFSAPQPIEFRTDRVDIQVSVRVEEPGEPVSDNTVIAGDDLTYVAAIRNGNGNGVQSEDAILTTFLPRAAAFSFDKNDIQTLPVVAADKITLDATTGLIRVNFGPLDSGRTGTVRFTVQPSVPGYLSTRFFAESGGINDNRPQNDSATITTTVNLDPKTSILNFQTPDFSVQESGVSAVITVERSNSFAGTITVDYNAIDGSAVSGTNYQIVPGTLTFGAGEFVKTFLVTILDNANLDPNRSLGLVLRNPTNPEDPNARVILGSLGRSTLTIFDDDPPTPATQTLSFAQTDFSAQENAGTASVTIQRTGSTAGTVSVKYASSDGTAIAGTDYTAVSGTLVFNNGELTKSISVPLIDNSVLDGNKVFNITLSNSVGAVVGTPATSPVTIIDDESPPAGFFQFSASTFLVNENQGRAFVTVTRKSGTGPATVSYSTTAGTAVAGVRYTPVSGTIQFGAADTIKSFEVPIINTTTFEGTQTVGLGIQVGGQAVLGTPSTATLSILDDDSPPVAVLQLSQPTYTVDESSGLATITVTRTGGLSEPVAVFLSTGGGTATANQDYTLVNHVVMFGPGQATATVDIPINNDQEIESSETFGVSLTAPSNGAVLGATSSAVVTIANDDRDLSSPLVTDLRLGSAGNATTSVVLGFSEALSTASVADLSHYSLVSFGRDGVLGTTDDRLIPIASAAFDAASNSVALSLTSGVPNGQFASLMVGGLTDLSGNVMDGDANGLPGGNYAATFGRSTTLRYRDADGDLVTLQLRNGGLLELTRNAQGEGQVLRLVNPILNRSVLSGTVQRRAAGTTSFVRIEGLDPFGRIKTTLKTPPFYAGEVTGLTGGLASARSLLNARRNRRG
jgi:Calx-beta domain